MNVDVLSPGALGEAVSGDGRLASLRKPAWHGFDVQVLVLKDHHGAPLPDRSYDANADPSPFGRGRSAGELRSKAFQRRGFSAIVASNQKEIGLGLDNPVVPEKEGHRLGSRCPAAPRQPREIAGHAIESAIADQRSQAALPSTAIDLRGDVSREGIGRHRGADRSGVHLGRRPRG